MTTAARASADVGLIGLAVMGQNLLLNMADHGYRVAVYNRTTAVMEEFVAGHGNTPGGRLVGAAALPDFVAALKTPERSSSSSRRGAPVEAVVVASFSARASSPNDIVVEYLVILRLFHPRRDGRFSRSEKILRALGRLHDVSKLLPSRG